MKLAQSKVHFIGIGGIGMCGLAELLHNMGAQVTGSDLGENAQTTRLRGLGISIAVGHQAENVKDSEVVVYSSAVKSDNPEFRAARVAKIPLIPRAEALAEIMRLKRGIAVGGSHGKTTTTSMTAAIFLHANVQPTIVVGGRLDLIKSTALLGTGEWLVAEADESDGSFLKLSPEIAVITNIDNDHLDHYGSLENLKKAYFEFALRVPFYGLAIVCGDDPLIREVFAEFPKRIVYYGFDAQNDLQLRGQNGVYEVLQNGERLGEMHLQVPGRHNALNAAAALATGLEAGFSFAVCEKGLQNFVGVDRRFQFKGSVGGIDIYDDYGHHPTEVLAVLQAFREKFPNRRLVTVFQPHRYSRTELCWDQFLDCFKEADHVFLCDIYAAGEKSIAGVNSAELSKELRHKSSEYLPNSADRASQIRTQIKSGDVLITLGAGDVWKLGMEILEGKPAVSAR
jgi:UDP-N-acetylmuramate--alanine ligase